MNKGITLFGTTSNLKNIGLNLKKIGFNLKEFGTTWFFYIYLKKKVERLDKCLFKVDTDTGNLKEFFHNLLNFEKNFETTRFQLEKNWKKF